jgi:NAD(P)-dependent dehydrogenase (short-subunit alcohol dehydrogenase family)
MFDDLCRYVRRRRDVVLPPNAPTDRRSPREAKRLEDCEGTEVRDVSAVVLWLMSEEASYVTGSIVDISGGRVTQ